MRLRVRTVALDDDRPLLSLLPRADDGTGPADAVAWVRTSARAGDAPADEGLVGWGTAARLSPGAGPHRFAAAEAALRALDVDERDEVSDFGTGLVGFGTFAFTDAGEGSLLVVPRVVIGRRDGVTWRTTVEVVDRVLPALPGLPAAGAALADPARDRARFAGSSQPDVHWLEAVARAVERLRAGEAAKVVLARDHAVWSEQPFDAGDLARRLAARFPRCHTFVVDGFVGATPELLLARRGRAVFSRVLAGTTGRSDDEAQDAALGAALLASAKDLEEHRFAAESVRDVLAPRCADLVHDDTPRLLRLDNVQHLATAFEGTLGADRSALEVVAALHPTAAVGGTPRGRAVAMIAELEGMDRARYAAPVGWTDRDGDGEWGIALRCAELNGARARLFAGVGIVTASLPEAELEETRLKLLAMQAALGEDPAR
ncbi:isochorismate synthase [Egicoccus halophilus]|uniref:isochorismate synthase n=1 Tax=Egicoccus halophilus TaxID=1670830 RepID=A0A8J3AD56_9ACTN|nr:isochorismate synthase [Egicoccus halophilus]GGI05707.1 isochorismate synthase [Egicoccus halophilus]